MEPPFSFDLPFTFKSSSHQNPKEDSNMHLANVRKTPLAPQPQTIMKNIEMAGPVKPPRQILEQNSSSSEEDNDNYEDPILKKSREQENIETFYDDSYLEPKVSNNQEFVDPYNKIKGAYDNPSSKSYDYKSLKIPCSHEVLLQGHSKSVTAIALDHAGIRIATGSNDYKVRLWDFEGMNKNMNSFRILEPMPVHPIKNLSFNVSSHEILVIASNAQPKIINRDGKELIECIKGDMYIKDMNQTRGHVSMVYDGCFHPTEKYVFGSCSLDGTIRLWDRNMKLINIEQQMTQKQVIKCKDQKGLKTGVSAMTFNNDGSLIMGCCLDGSIQGFSAKSHYTRPDFTISNAVNSNNEVTKILFLNDNQRFCVRSLDNTMKIWDIRHTKKPLNVWYNLANYAPGSKICFSPDQKYVVTGTSVRKNSDEEQSSLLFYDSVTFEQIADINMGNISITDIKWHPVLNQLFVGKYLNFSLFYLNF